MTATHINFLMATIKDLQILLRKGKITSVQLVQSYLNRIKENNEEGLQLRAVQDESARVAKLFEIAKSLDDLRSQGTELSGLHGIPLLVKDSIGTDEELGMATSAGSYALLNSIPSRDATVIAKLRAADAIILGKATMNELSNLKGSAQKTGWSARGGQGQSAYVEGGYAAGGDPLGSSSGSTIAVSAGFSPAALGAETVGSLIAPAARAALFALRPTMGLVSRNGTVPGASSLDVVGPMGKSTYDVALLLQHIAGSDSKDDSNSHATKYSVFTSPQYATFKGKRLGVPRATVFDSDVPWGNDPKRSPKMRSELESAIGKMRELGATICDPADIPSSKEWVGNRATYRTVVITHEYKDDMAKYLSTTKRTDVKNLREIINFIEQHPELEMPDGEKSYDFLMAADSTEGRDSEAYRDTIATYRRICGEEGIDKIMSDKQLDALILPINALSTCYAAFGGYPVAVVPLGTQDNGEPFGFCLLGRKWSEPTLLALTTFCLTRDPRC